MIMSMSLGTALLGIVKGIVGYGSYAVSAYGVKTAIVATTKWVVNWGWWAIVIA